MLDKADTFTLVLAATETNEPQRIAAIILIIAAAAAAVALLALVIGALVSVARSSSYTGVEKICWAGIVIIFPLVGSLGWFGMGRRMREMG